MDFFQRIARTGVAFLPDGPSRSRSIRMRRGSVSTDVRAMLADGTRVIERAFDADPRVGNPSEVTLPAPIRPSAPRRWQSASTLCGVRQPISAGAAAVATAQDTIRPTR